MSWAAPLALSPKHTRCARAGPTHLAAALAQGNLACLLRAMQHPGAALPHYLVILAP